MSCCSKRRHAISSTTQLRAAASAASASGSATPRPAQGTAAKRLRYLGDSPLSLRGPFSGRVYVVDATSRYIEADVRDADPLLRTALFEPAAG
jgi:hypothetical protein